jgi:ATP-dependent Clp protease ATP-binding subunit ClpB
MDPNRFTEKVQEALRAAQTKAVRYSHQQIDVEHLALALLEQEGGLAVSILLKAGLQAESVHRRLEAELDKAPKVTSPIGAPADQVYITNRLQRACSPRPKTRPAASRTSTSRSSICSSR